MNQGQSISMVIFDELFTTIQKVGIDNTVKILQEAKQHSLILNDNNIDFILKTVSELTDVEVDRILKGIDRSDERKMAVSLCVYFIKEEYSYSLPDLKKIFNRDVSALSRHYTLVQKRPKVPKTDFDKTLEMNFKKIKLLITEKKINDGQSK